MALRGPAPEGYEADHRAWPCPDGPFCKDAGCAAVRAARILELEAKCSPEQVQAHGKYGAILQTLDDDELLEYHDLVDEGGGAAMRGVPESGGGEMAEPEWIECSVVRPATMGADEAVRRALALFPCATDGHADVMSEEPAMLCLNVGCPRGFYRAAPDSSEYGPDEAGVTVAWEKP